MTRPSTRLLPIALLTLLVVPLWAWPAHSYSPYLDQLRAMYPYEFACSVCHDADHGLNAFGKDFKAALAKTGDPYKALKAIEALDSDGDGVSNGDELRAGTLPEDRFSKPNGAKTKVAPLPAPGSDVPASDDSAQPTPIPSNQPSPPATHHPTR